MTTQSETRTGRRQLLQGGLIVGTTLLSGFDRLLWAESAEAQGANTSPRGKLVGALEFSGEARVPLGKVFGTELDGRLYTDLSGLSAEHPVTANEQFYIRTRASKLLDDIIPWEIRLGGLIEKPLAIPMPDLEKMSSPMGLHLMECAGNVRSIHFGMISVANWNGVTLADVFQKAKAKPSANRILISGFDAYAAKSASSISGRME